LGRRLFDGWAARAATARSATTRSASHVAP